MIDNGYTCLIISSILPLKFYKLIIEETSLISLLIISRINGVVNIPENREHVKKNFYFIPFGQDDPIKKPNSMVCNPEYLIPTCLYALNKRQIQPVILGGDDL